MAVISREAEPLVTPWVCMEYEFRRLSLPRTIPRSAVRRLLTDHAEYGGWELSRLRLFPDGSRRVELRRRIIRVRSTLGVHAAPRA